jgi:hypothetical protein
MRGLQQIPAETRYTLSNVESCGWLWLMREGQVGERNHRWRLDFLAQVADSPEMQSQTRYQESLLAGFFDLSVKRTVIPPFEKSWARLLRSINSSVDPDHLVELLVSLLCEQAYLPRDGFPLGEDARILRVCSGEKRRKHGFA